MAVPVLQQGNLLIASVQDALSDVELAGLRDELMRRVGAVRARGVVIDVSGVDVIDSYTARLLNTTVSALQLRGAETVIAGIQPDVAFAMVQLGLRLDGIHTVLDLEEGLVYLRERIKGGGRRERGRDAQ